MASTKDNKVDIKVNYIHNILLSTYYPEDVYAYIAWAQSQLPQVEDESIDSDEAEPVLLKEIKQEILPEEDDPVFVKVVKNGKEMELPPFHAQDFKPDLEVGVAKHIPGSGELGQAGPTAATITPSTHEALEAVPKSENDSKYKSENLLATPKYRLEYQTSSARHGKREKRQQDNKDRQQSYITQLHDVCNRKHWPLPLWTLEQDEDRRRIHRHQAAVKIRDSNGRVMINCIDPQRTSTQSMTRERVARLALVEIHAIDKK